MDCREFPLAEYFMLCSGLGAMQGAIMASSYGVRLDNFYMMGFAMLAVGTLMLVPWMRR